MKTLISLLLLLGMTFSAFADTKVRIGFGVSINYGYVYGGSSYVYTPYYPVAPVVVAPAYTTYPYAYTTPVYVAPPVAPVYPVYPAYTVYPQPYYPAPIYRSYPIPSYAPGYYRSQIYYHSGWHHSGRPGGHR